MPPGNDEALAKAILRLKQEPRMLREMGASARDYVVTNFYRSKQAEEFFQLVNGMKAERSEQLAESREESPVDEAGYGFISLFSGVMGVGARYGFYRGLHPDFPGKADFFRPDEARVKWRSFSSLQVLYDEQLLW